MQVNTRYINSTKGTSSAQTQSRFDAKEKYWQGSGRSDQAASLHRLFVPGVLIPVCCAQTTVVSQIRYMLVTVVLHKHFWMTANTFSEQKAPWSCDNASLLRTDKKWFVKLDIPRSQLELDYTSILERWYIHFQSKKNHDHVKLMPLGDELL